MQNPPNKEPNFDEIGMPAEAQGENTDALLGKEVLGTRGIYDLKDGSGTIGEVELYEWFQLMEDIHGMPKWQSHEIITNYVDVPDKWVRQVLDSIYGYSGGYDVPDEEAEPGWSWGEVGELILDPGFNISNPLFVQDFFSAVWNAVTEMRHLPGMAKGIGSDMVKEGFWTADLWDIVTEKNENAQRAKWKRYEKNFPVISQILADFPKRYSSPRRLREANLENPWDQISDALMFVLEPGSKVAGALGKYGRFSKIRKVIPDPTELPGRLIGAGLSRGAVPYANELVRRYPNLIRWGVHKGHYNPDVEITTGQSPTGEPITITKPVLDIAEDMGIAEQDVLSSVKMEAGIQGVQRRTVNELGVVNPYDTETVAERVYAAIEAHQSDVDVNLRQKYKALSGEELMDQMIQFADDTADPIPSTHAFLESKKPKNIKDIEYEKVMQVLEDIIPDGRKIETLDDLNQFRTQFRERMITAFRSNEITKIGKGTFVDDVYAHLTDDLHNAIRETVGQPLRNDVMAADTAWKKAMDDRDSNAGLFIYSPTNLADPMKMIDGLLDGKLSTDADITKFYEMVGPAAKKEIQAALVARIFQRALDDNDNWSPTGLSDVLKSIVSGKKGANQLEMLLGDDALAESLTLKIYEISEFSKMMDKVRNVKDSLKIAFIMHGLTSVGAAVAGANASDILKSWGIAGDVVEGAFVFGSTFAVNNGLEFAKNAFGEKRFVKVLKDPEFMERFMEGVHGEERVAAVVDWFEKQRNVLGATLEVTD